MLAYLLRPEIEELIERGDLQELQQTLEVFEPAEIGALLEALPAETAAVLFRTLPRRRAAEVFEYLPHDGQMRLVEQMAAEKERLAALLNDLSPDDRTAFLEELPPGVAQNFLSMLDSKEREVAVKLLGHPEDSVGRLATTDYIAVRPDWTVEQALRQVRRYGRDSETINTLYVVDQNWKLLDEIRLRDILLADPETSISELMDNRFVALKTTDDQEHAVRIFQDYNRTVLPVVDSEGTLAGIVTVDDVFDVAETEATEDIHKLGGMDALDEPYIDASIPTLVKKRARWLVVLFLGEMLTTSAMGYFESEIQRAVVLTLFIPLIISSGGNSGSQAASLIIRSLAIGEIRLRDWRRVLRRELVSGLMLGAILGAVGFVRVALWAVAFGAFGAHWPLIGLSVSLALVGVVMFGTLAGSLLPFLMQRLGADPAASSAPFVATLVDVSGLVIYFSVAALLLSGTLL